MIMASAFRLRLRVSVLRLCALALPLLAPAAHAQTPETEVMVVKETGPRDKRVNIVILGDGYVASEKAKFLTHMKTVADAVIKDLPLTEYSDYFNLYGIFVPSNQSGADIPAQGIMRDTYYGASYSGRLLTISTTKAFSVINKNLPEADMQFIVVNYDMYGGSGGQVAVANYADPEIIAHEAQHSFSGLGDEYDYEGVTPWESPNTTKQTNRSQVRWNHWIAETTPVPTPETQAYAKLSGLFEGAAYNATGWYRPKQNCRMRENGIPFCEACSETIILSMYEKVSPMDSAFPKPGVAPVAVAMNEIPPLRVKPKVPLEHTLAVAWIVDGKLVSTASGTQFNQTLAPGSHKVTARVTDTTHMVRKDPDGLLNDSVSWQVSVFSTTALGGMGNATAPTLLGANAKEAWFRATAGRMAAIRLLSADGRELENRSVRGDASGRGRVAWSHAQAPGHYLIELASEGRRFRFACSFSP